MSFNSSKKTKLTKEVLVKDPNAPPETVYELHLRSMVSRLVQKCQGYCQKVLVPADNEDYFLVRSYARSYYTHDGKEVSKILSQYVHFQKDCLKYLYFIFTFVYFWSTCPLIIKKRFNIC